MSYIRLPATVSKDAERCTLCVAELLEDDLIRIFRGKFKMVVGFQVGYVVKTPLKICGPIVHAGPAAGSGLGGFFRIKVELG